MLIFMFCMCIIVVAVNTVSIYDAGTLKGSIKTVLQPCDAMSVCMHCIYTCLCIVFANTPDYCSNYYC